MIEGLFQDFSNLAQVEAIAHVDLIEQDLLDIIIFICIAPGKSPKRKNARFWKNTAAIWSFPIISGSWKIIVA